MTLDDFLATYFDRGVFAQLAALSSLGASGTATKSVRDAHARSLLVVAVGAIEVLGSLVGPKYRDKPRRNFRQYWREILYPGNTLDRVIHTAARTGMTNEIIAGAPVITAGEGMHLEITDGVLTVDVYRLVEDLRASYEILVTEGRRQVMQARLDDLLVRNTKVFAKLAG